MGDAVFVRGGRDTILIVDDDEDDQWLFKESLTRTGCQVNIVALQDGGDAVNYLKGEGQFEDRSQYPMPKVVFLDSLLPHLRGDQVLKFIKNTPGLSRIPVVILTGGLSAADIGRMYDLGANAVCFKPSNVRELDAFGASVCQFWVQGTVSGEED
jgi:CheY-like chemotaxis protein